MFFSGFDVYCPKTRKKHKSLPIPKNMVPIDHTGKNVRSVLLFRWVLTHFFCHVNELVGEEGKNKHLS